MTEQMTQSEVRKLMRGEHVPRKQSLGKYMTAIEITLPLPPKVLHPNGRTRSYMKKSRLTKAYREACAIAAYAALDGYVAPRWKLAECQCTFYLERRRDQDGLLSWMKAGFDGLQGIVIQNDSGFVHLPPLQVTAKEAKGERKVVLQITERKA